VITTFDLGKGASRPLTEADVRAGLHDNWYRYALILPRIFSRTTLSACACDSLFNPRNEIESQMVNGLLQKTIFSNVPQLLGQSLQKNARRFLGDERFEQFNRTIANTVADNFGGDREEIYRRNIGGDFGFGAVSQPEAKPETATHRDSGGSTRPARNQKPEVRSRRSPPASPARTAVGRGARPGRQLSGRKSKIQDRKSKSPPTCSPRL